MKITYFLLGLALMLVAIFLGLYVGVYILLYKTVVIFIADPGFIAFVWACIKWTIAGVGGWGVFGFIAVPAAGLMARGLK